MEAIKELKAMLFELLAELERCEDVEATKTDKGGNHIVLDIQFKH